MTDRIISEVARDCLVTRTRKISRVLTGIYDGELRPFEITSPQFSLMVVISRLRLASRAEIGRENNLDRSTLTRNLQLMLARGWIREVARNPRSRRYSIEVTDSGRAMLERAAPAWRKAQRRAKSILGKDGVAVVTNVADAV